MLTRNAVLGVDQFAKHRSLLSLEFGATSGMAPAPQIISTSMVMSLKSQSES